MRVVNQLSGTETVYYDFVWTSASQSNYTFVNTSILHGFR